MPGTYEAVGWMMRMCFLAQFLEILHPMVGYTKGSAFESIIQVWSKLILKSLLYVLYTK